MLLALLHAGSLGSISWFLTFLLAFPILLCAAVPAFLYRCFRRKKELPLAQARQGRPVTGMTRRTFLKGAMVAIPALSMSTSVLGNIVGEEYLSLTTLKLSFKKLPDYLEGYRIGHISDTHIGLFFSPDDLEEAIKRLAGEHVNRLEITGDLIDELSRLPACQAVLQRTAHLFPDGIDFCYGNHEYYRGLKEITDMLEETPVHILRNENLCASPGFGRDLKGRSGSDPAPFYIAAADFSFARTGPDFDAERQSYTEQALAAIPENAFTILLAHHSAFIDEGFAKRIPLTLCGHTHGAQFAPIGPLVQAVGFKYLRGLFKKDGCYGYVNRGTGHWLPFRVFCSREITVYELRQAR